MSAHEAVTDFMMKYSTQKAKRRLKTSSCVYSMYQQNKHYVWQRRGSEGYMNVVIEVHFISNENKVMQRGSFPLRGRKPERVAFDWWKQIKREMPFGAELSKLLINGEDKTEIIKELEWRLAWRNQPQIDFKS